MFEMQVCRRQLEPGQHKKINFTGKRPQVHNMCLRESHLDIQVTVTNASFHHRFTPDAYHRQQLSPAHYISVIA